MPAMTTAMTTNSAIIEAVDYEGRGVAHVDGKALFIEGALPGEHVEYVVSRRKPTYEQGRVVRVIAASPLRVQPQCPHFGVCGGCSLQHLDTTAQAAVKQRLLEDAFWRLARLRPQQMLSPLIGPAWGYRHRARLSVRKVVKKGCVLVGFHERRSSYVAVMDSCAVLPPPVSALLPALRRLVESLSIAERLPQIEVAVGDDGVALVLRILEPLLAADEEVLRAFADRHGVVLYLQPGGPATATLFYPPTAGQPHYRLPDLDVDIAFAPTDFTQVNHQINRVLLRRAIALLQPQPHERVADMFCGLGNFSLPLARSGARVFGVEGASALVAQAQRNALANGLQHCTEFCVANLFEATPQSLAAWGRFDKMLIDPPREGAINLVKAIGEGVGAPQRIVYVSCNPATLARDAAVLVHEKGYQLQAAGVANMFAHTSHVESIALFVLQPHGGD